MGIPQVRARLLVVDDDPMILGAMRRALHGHDLVCVSNAREALARIAGGEPFDVILSDVMMPNMTGVDFYASLLASHPHLAPRMIFMTGGVPDPQIARALEEIPNPKVSKPTPTTTLRAAIQLMLVA